MLRGTEKFGLTLKRMEYGRALKGELLMNSSGPPVPYAQPLLDAVSLFEELQLGYALAGGIAAMYYGRARFTEDVDFVAVSGHMDRFSANPQVMQKHRFVPSCAFTFYHHSCLWLD